MHEEECICDVFSDLYKDVYGHRPKIHFTCKEAIEWEKEHYEDDPEDPSIRKMKSCYFWS